MKSMSRVAHFSDCAETLDEARQMLREYYDKNLKARRELAEARDTIGATFEANQRAIKHWQAANPGNDLTWPDTTKLTIWLVGQFVEAKKDTARLDWLADPKNTVGNVVLPREYIMDNLDSMRAAIDAAMEGGK